MYCIKCGAELSEGQKKCPLCETEVYHPDFLKIDNDTYPKNNTPPDKFEQKGLMFIVTMMFLIPFVLCLLCDVSVHETVVWSGYAMSGIALAYLVLALPFWFRRPNPVIFVPCDFVGMLGVLFYIDFATQGGWFLTFALPTVGAFAVLATAFVAIYRYVRRGRLYLYSGSILALGAYMVGLEALISNTFDGGVQFIWSRYPFSVAMIFGIMLLVIAICKPLRNSLKKKFFL